MFIRYKDLQNGLKRLLGKCVRLQVHALGVAQ